mgnify:CR=1 FL=1
MNIFKYIIILVLVGMTYSCGFKVVNKSEYFNFKFTSIETLGEKRINYQLKNKLFSNNTKKNNKTNIKLILETSKKKTIKEKNTKNQITKFQIIIVTQVQLLGNYEIENMDKFTVTKTGEYLVHEQHSQTLNNEKKLLKTLTNALAEDILEGIAQKINAL